MKIILHTYLNLFTYVPKFKTIGILKKQTYFIVTKCLCFDYEMRLYSDANTFVFTKEHSISFKRYGISFETYGVSLKRNGISFLRYTVSFIGSKTICT